MTQAFLFLVGHLSCGGALEYGVMYACSMVTFTRGQRLVQNYRKLSHEPYVHLSKFQCPCRRNLIQKVACLENGRPVLFNRELGSSVVLRPRQRAANLNSVGMARPGQCSGYGCGLGTAMPKLGTGQMVKRRRGTAMPRLC